MLYLHFFTVDMVLQLIPPPAVIAAAVNFELTKLISVQRLSK